MDSQQEVQAQITMTVTTSYPTGSSGIRHSLKQYGGKRFILNPLTLGNFVLFTVWLERDKPYHKPVCRSYT